MVDIWRVLAITVVCIAAAVVLFAIGIMIRSIIQAAKSKNFTKLIFNLLSVLCIALAAWSWLFNMGWIRFVLTFWGIPVIHAAAFFFINNFAATYTNKSSC